MFLVNVGPWVGERGRGNRQPVFLTSPGLGESPQSNSSRKRSSNDMFLVNVGPWVGERGRGNRQPVFLTSPGLG
ncbi:hypothetical protein BaRGS_00034185, partial [Batillaria attramentaria]